MNQNERIKSNIFLRAIVIHTVELQRGCELLLFFIITVKFRHSYRPNWYHLHHLYKCGHSTETALLRVYSDIVTTILPCADKTLYFAKFSK